MKIAISGKGGVGKTTLAAAVARLFARENKKVLVIDADPAPNLALALGIPRPWEMVPVSEMKELIKERTGATSEEYGKFFKLNPTVADLPEKLWVEKDGVRLVVLGAIRRGGGGCACPENVFLRSLLNHIILQRDEVAVADMEAGVEHLGRASVRAVNALIVVVEPSLPSIQTAHRIKELASDIGLRSIFAVGNKLMDEEQKGFIRDSLKDIPILGFLSYNPMVQEAALKGTPVEDNELLMREAMEIVKRLKEALGVT